ncbi:MAG: DMT family transporter [bacterium]
MQDGKPAGCISPGDNATSWFSRYSLYLLLAVMFWGLSFIAIKYALRELDPVPMIAARFLLAGPVLYLIIRAKGLRIRTVEKRGKLVLASLVVFFHFWIMATGLKEVSASHTAWILSTAPVFITLLAWLWLKERFASVKWLGVALAIAGVVVMTANGTLENLGWINSRGDLIVLSSCVTWAVHTVITRDLTTRIDPLVATFWMTGIAGLIFVPLTLVTDGPSIWTDLDLWTWLSLIFLGVFCLAIAFWLWAEGLAKQTAARVGVYLYIEPLFAMFFAWLLLGEAITLWLILGAGMITAGVYVTERFGRERRQITSQPPSLSAETAGNIP